MKTNDNFLARPFSEQELRELWNRQADEFNQWDSLDFDKKLAWAQAQAIWATVNWFENAVLRGEQERLLKMLKTTDNHHHA